MENQNQQKPNIPERERMDQMLCRFQSLLLNTPDRQNPDRQVPRAPPGHRPGDEIYGILALPWRQRVPTQADCEDIVNYYNLTMEIMRDLHKDHAAKAELLKSFQEITYDEENTLAGLVGIIPPIPTSYQEYIFNCSMCYDMFSMLYATITSGQRSALAEVFEQRPRPSSEIEPNIDECVLPFLDTERLTSSPIPNLPSTSQQYIFDCTNTPLSLDPITPSTSTFFSFSEAAQLLAMEVGPHAAPVRVKKFLKTNKENKAYQRPPKPEKK